MTQFTVHSLDYDRRLRAICANLTVSYKWYLRATEGAESNLTIQRKIIKGAKSYATLRHDIKLGCVLPPIVLAAKVEDRNQILSSALEPTIEDPTQADLPALQEILKSIQPRDIYIIDGLQRTNALRQVREELRGDAKALEQFLNRSLRTEIWLNIRFSALAYRMLLLNAGQKPMSIKHQVEILSQNLKVDLQSVAGIEIIDTGRRRVQPGQFQLSKLALAFQAWLQGNPNVEVRNIVVEQMMADSAIETLGSVIEPPSNEDHTDSFKHLVEWLVAMDSLVGSDNLEFFGNETVLQGIAAAIGSAQRNQLLRARVEQCLSQLKHEAEASINEDVISIQVFETIRKGIDPSKKNIGEATRDIVFTAFQEFFVSNGLKNMGECWNFAGARQ